MIREARFMMMNIEKKVSALNALLFEKQGLDWSDDKKIIRSGTTPDKAQGIHGKQLCAKGSLDKTCMGSVENNRSTNMDAEDVSGFQYDGFHLSDLIPLNQFHSSI